MTKEEAKQIIVELVEKYQKLTPKNIKGFNEAATKHGFIEPLFRALGWDFENTNEVSPEEHASNGRDDYAFKLCAIVLNQVLTVTKQIAALVTLTVDAENADHSNTLVKFAAKDIRRLYVFSDECKVKSAAVIPNYKRRPLL